MDSSFEGGAKKVKAVGSRRQVLQGTASKTAGGLKSSDIKKNSEGKLVSRAASDAGKKNFKHISGFHQLVMKIYKAMPNKGAKSLSQAMKMASKQWKSSPRK